MARTEPIPIGISETRGRLSEILEGVASKHETFLITRRGRPIARLAPPVTVASEAPSLRELPGWTEGSDPFFETIDQVVEERSACPPMCVRDSRLREKRC